MFHACTSLLSSFPVNNGTIVYLVRMSATRQVINSLNPVRPKATSLEIERESFEKGQQLSISKAINDTECPVKEKHVRSK